MMSNISNMNVLTKTRMAHESNSLINAVGEYLLDNYSIVEKYNNKVIESRDSLKIELAKLNIKTHGSNGNFLLLDIGDPEKAKNFVNFLREKLIYVKGPWSKPRDKYITITIGPKELMNKFLDATKEFLKNY